MGTVCIVTVHIRAYYYLDKKKKNHPRDSQREERCSTCDIMLDQARSAQGKSDPRLSATFALRWSRLIEHDMRWQRSSRRESRGWFFFLSRVVVCVISNLVEKDISTANDTSEGILRNCNCRHFCPRSIFVYFVLLAECTKLGSIRKPHKYESVCNTASRCSEIYCVRKFSNDRVHLFFFCCFFVVCICHILHASMIVSSHIKKNYKYRNFCDKSRFYYFWFFSLLASYFVQAIKRNSKFLVFIYLCNCHVGRILLKLGCFGSVCCHKFPDPDRLICCFVFTSLLVFLQ